MTTTTDTRTEEQNPSSLLQPDPRHNRNQIDRKDGRGQSHLWTKACATAGAATWAGIAVLARIGVARIGAIELLFLFAPLVIVPLGIELGRGLARESGVGRLGRRLQPLGAVLAVMAMWLPPGRAAGLLALGWMAVCLSIASGGVGQLAETVSEHMDGISRTMRIAFAVARIDLAIGGAWLTASRWGMRPMSIQEPIGLLTAVHFHYAGFATATIAAATLAFARDHGRVRGLTPLVWVVVLLPIVVAAGFVISPVLKLSAALLFSASVAALAVFLRSHGRRVQDPMARVLLQTAAAAVFAGMVLSALYALGDFAGSDALPIPPMARTHGILNAVGFCLPGLLGWLVENSASGT